jgi:hypothetical protein
VQVTDFVFEVFDKLHSQYSLWRYAGERQASSRRDSRRP